MNERMTYDEFRKEWLSRHRMSLPKREKVLGVQEWFWIIFWVFVALAGAVFSGVHTIPAAELTILNDVQNRRELAMTVFVIVELVIFGAAANRKAIDWLKWLLLGALTVALISNVSSSIRAVNVNDTGNWVSQASGVLQSILAPLTAFAAGEVLHYQLGLRAKKKREADEDYQKEWGKVEGKIETAFAKYVREHDGELPNISQNFMKSGETNQLHEAVHEAKKPRIKLHEVARLVHENGDGDLPAAEMVAKYGISMGSTTKVREMLKSMNEAQAPVVSANGNGGG